MLLLPKAVVLLRFHKPSTTFLLLLLRCCCCCCRPVMLCAELHSPHCPLPLRPQPHASLALRRLCPTCSRLLNSPHLPTRAPLFCPLPDSALSILLTYCSIRSRSCPCCPQDLLQRRSDMVGWHERHSQLFHRSNWGVGPRRGLMPLLQSYSNGSGGLSAAGSLL